LSLPRIRYPALNLSVREESDDQAHDRRRDEWLAARLELLKAEKELTRRSDELARRRQELPWVRIDKEYRFETDSGSASLTDLFKGRSHPISFDQAGAKANMRVFLGGQQVSVRDP
jgi:Bacterial protein of unknown function (DUF899)